MERQRRSADHNWMRNINRSLILSCLRTSPPQSRANLAARTGLTRSTVSSLVDELIRANLVRETGISPSRGGRPGTLLQLNPDGGCAIGVEITLDSIMVLLTDFVAQPRWLRQIEVKSTDPDVVISQAECLIDEALTFNARTHGMKPLGIGLGIAGLVNPEEGVLRLSSNLGWRDIPFRTRWQERFDLPVKVGNEASIAALGESYFGAAVGYTNFVYLVISTTALGGGIFVNGRLYQGVDGYAGEAGHMVIDPAGPPCTCGKRGCWETVLRAACALEPIRKRLKQGQASSVLDRVQGDSSAITFQTVIDAAAQGDALVASAVNRVTNILATGIGNLVNLFNPQLIVLGGPLGLAMGPFLPAIETAVAAQAVVPAESVAEIRLSQIRSNACAMGAVALVLDEILREPSW
ncbi:MAG TPA: ROK family transcriptional regulator [Aggregatilineaceae bacterium]|nr:ROK family transcriptional regulator [Aggregatilineaceae bacterium]